LCSQVRTRFGSPPLRCYRLQLPRRSGYLALPVPSVGSAAEIAESAFCTSFARMRAHRIFSVSSSNDRGERLRGAHPRTRRALSPSTATDLGRKAGTQRGCRVLARIFSRTGSKARTVASAGCTVVATRLSWECHDCKHAAALGGHPVARRARASTNARMHALQRRQGRASGAIHCRRVVRDAWRSPKRPVVALAAGVAGVAGLNGVMSELTLRKWSCAGAPNGSGRARTI
jgi:hypothetical protein